MAHGALLPGARVRSMRNFPADSLTETLARRTAIRSRASHPPDAQFPRLPHGELQMRQELPGKERSRLDSRLLVIEGYGVNRLYFHSPDSALFHYPQFPLDFAIGDCRAKPPPSHHPAAIIRRLAERRFHFLDTCPGRARYRKKQENHRSRKERHGSLR